MGCIALLLLVVSEIGFVRWLRGLTIREYIASPDRVAGTMCYALFVVFATMRRLLVSDCFIAQTGVRRTPFSVSSMLGLLALLGVSVETAVILVSYINRLRLEGRNIRRATLDASLLRLRPIMMTALVACLGLLPAAISTGVGSDTQKPFAIVVVAGLLSRLFLGFFVNPVLYEIVAREGDVLQV